MANPSPDGVSEEACRNLYPFLDRLAHELRNPLVPIRNAAHLLPIVAPDQPRLIDLQDIITRQVEQMAQLIDDLIDLSHLASGELDLLEQPCDLARVVRETVEVCKRSWQGESRSFEVHVPDFPITVNGDLRRLTQIVQRLLDNACKFTDADGKIGVRLEAKNNKAVLMVQDDGIGFDPLTTSRMFGGFSQSEEWVTRPRGGLGLSLSLVKGLASLHGGSIELMSEGLNKGATMTVEFPLAASNQ